MKNEIAKKQKEKAKSGSIEKKGGVGVSDMELLKEQNKHLKSELEKHKRMLGLDPHTYDLKKLNIELQEKLASIKKDGDEGKKVKKKMAEHI